MHECHALPEGWHQMSYDTFLQERRKLMAAIIRRGFESLKQPSDSCGEMTPLAAPATSPEATESWKLATASAQTPPMVSAPATNTLLLEYWTALHDSLQASGATIRCNTVSAKSYLAARAPRNGTRAGFEISVTHEYIEVYFGGTSEDTIQQILNFTLEEKAAIEAECGCTFEWPQQAVGDRCWISAWKETDPKDRNAWPAQHAWMIETFTKLIPAVARCLR